MTGAEAPVDRAPLLDALQRRLTYSFGDPALLDRALCHASFAHEASVPSNERLEFLGDAILEAAIARELYARLPAATEGELSSHKHHLVSGAVLAEIGRELGVPLLLRVGRGARGRAVHQNPAMIEDATEAVLGAILLDGGFDAAARAVTALYADRLAAIDGPRRRHEAAKNIVTQLHEAAAAKPLRTIVHPILVGQVGSAHEPSFEVGWWCGGVMLATAWGTSKQNARRNAASPALDRMRELALAGWLPDRDAAPPEPFDEPGAELPGAELPGAELPGAELPGAELPGGADGERDP